MHAILRRDGGGDLAFQIEVLLTADLHFSFNGVGGCRYGAGGVALGPDDRPRLEPAVRGKCLFDGQQRRQGGIGDAGQTGGLAGGEVAGGGDQKDLLADVMDTACGQKGFVVRACRGTIGHVGEVCRGPDPDDPGGGADGGQVDGGDVGMGLGRQAKGEVQGTCGQRDVIDIAGRAGDVERRAVVGKGLAHSHG